MQLGGASLFATPAVGLLPRQGARGQITVRHVCLSECKVSGPYFRNLFKEAPSRKLFSWTRALNQPCR